MTHRFVMDAKEIIKFMCRYTKCYFFKKLGLLLKFLLYNAFANETGNYWIGGSFLKHVKSGKRHVKNMWRQCYFNFSMEDNVRFTKVQISLFHIDLWQDFYAYYFILFEEWNVCMYRRYKLMYNRSRQELMIKSHIRLAEILLLTRLLNVEIKESCWTEVYNEIYISLFLCSKTKCL